MSGSLIFFEYERIVSIVKLDERRMVSGKHATETRRVSITSGGSGTTLASSSPPKFGTYGFAVFANVTILRDGEAGGVALE